MNKEIQKNINLYEAISQINYKVIAHRSPEKVGEYFQAAKKGTITVPDAEKFVDTGNIFKTDSNYKMTFLHLEAHNEQPDVISAYLDKLTSEQAIQVVEAKDGFQRTPVYYLAMFGHFKSLQVVLDKYKSSFCSFGDDGKRQLSERIKRLIESPDIYGINPAQYAARQGKAKALEILLKEMDAAIGSRIGSTVEKKNFLTETSDKKDIATGQGYSILALAATPEIIKVCCVGPEDGQPFVGLGSLQDKLNDCFKAAVTLGNVKTAAFWVCEGAEPLNAFQLLSEAKQEVETSLQNLGSNEEQKAENKKITRSQAAIKAQIDKIRKSRLQGVLGNINKADESFKQLRNHTYIDALEKMDVDILKRVLDDQRWPQACEFDLLRSPDESHPLAYIINHVKSFYPREIEVGDSEEKEKDQKVEWEYKYEQQRIEYEFSKSMAMVQVLLVNMPEYSKAAFLNSCGMLCVDEETSDSNYVSFLYSPVHYAVMLKHPKVDKSEECSRDMLALLSCFKISLDTMDRLGNTPALLAAKYVNHLALEFLLTHGVKLEIRPSKMGVSSNIDRPTLSEYVYAQERCLAFYLDQKGGESSQQDKQKTVRTKYSHGLLKGEVNKLLPDQYKIFVDCSSQDIKRMADLLRKIEGRPQNSPLCEIDSKANSNANELYLDCQDSIAEGLKRYLPDKDEGFEKGSIIYRMFGLAKLLLENEGDLENEDIQCYLIETGLDFSTCDYQGRSILHYILQYNAIYKKHFQGTDVAEDWTEYSEEIIKTTIDRILNQVADLVDENKWHNILALLSARDHMRETVFHIVVQHGYEDILKLFWDIGGRDEFQTTKSHWQGVVRSYINEAFCYSADADDAFIPRDQLADEKHDSVVRINLPPKPHDGYTELRLTPLAVACWLGDEEMISMLVQMGAYTRPVDSSLQPIECILINEQLELARNEKDEEKADGELVVCAQDQEKERSLKERIELLYGNGDCPDFFMPPSCWGSVKRAGQEGRRYNLGPVQMPVKNSKNNLVFSQETDPTEDKFSPDAPTILERVVEIGDLDALDFIFTNPPFSDMKLGALEGTSIGGVLTALLEYASRLAFNEKDGVKKSRYEEVVSFLETKLGKFSKKHYAYRLLKNEIRRGYKAKRAEIKTRLDEFMREKKERAGTIIRESFSASSRNQDEIIATIKQGFAVDIGIEFDSIFRDLFPSLENAKREMLLDIRERIFNDNEELSVIFYEVDLRNNYINFEVSEMFGFAEGGPKTQQRKTLVQDVENLGQIINKYIEGFKNALSEFGIDFDIV